MVERRNYEIWERSIRRFKCIENVCEENDGRCSKCMLRNGEGYCGVFTDSRGDCYDKLKDWELKNYENPRVILS